MCAILQLVSAPLNPILIAEHFRRSHPQCEHIYIYICFAHNEFRLEGEVTKEKEILSYVESCGTESMEHTIIASHRCKSFVHRKVPHAKLQIWIREY